MPSSTPAHLLSIFKMRCPNCRKGSMFTQKSIFPFKGLLQMPEHCPVCDQKMEIEPGFYYGTGYVSYALSVALLAISFVLYHLLFGLSYKDNSFFYALGSSIGLILLLQPLIMRYSRVLYLHMFVKYGKGSSLNS